MPRRPAVAGLFVQDKRQGGTGIAQSATNINTVAGPGAGARQCPSLFHQSLHMNAQRQWPPGDVAAGQRQAQLPGQRRQPPAEGFQPGRLCLRQGQSQKKTVGTRSHGRQVTGTEGQTAPANQKRVTMDREMHIGHESVQTLRQLPVSLVFPVRHGQQRAIIARPQIQWHPGAGQFRAREKCAYQLELVQVLSLTRSLDPVPAGQQGPGQTPGNASAWPVGRECC